MVELSPASIAVAALVSLCYGVIFRSPRRYLLPAAAIGTLAFILLRLFSSFLQPNFATFLVALSVGVLSHICARTTGKPAQAFLVPGVVFLLQGVGVYRGFAAVFAENYAGSAETIVPAIFETCGISFGVLLANWLVPPRKIL